MVGNLFFAALLCTMAAGLVLHPNNEPPTNWSNRPSSNVVGRWGSNASCVAISADCVLTTAHQGGGVGTAVVIGGQTYYVARVEKYGNDIRVAKLRLAELTDYVAPYTNSDEAGKQIVIGGFGKGRGQEVKGNTVYGYQWAASGNTVLRWGSNIIDTVQTVNNNPCLKADFDAPDVASSTQYEAIMAEYDSGGGWFIDNEGQWKVAGLNYTVQTHGTTPNESRFKDPLTGINAPDAQFAHRVSIYADWITATALQLADCGNEPADITEDCSVDIKDLKELAKWWASQPSSSQARQRADINDDTSVNLLDFAIIAANWNKNY